MEITLPTGQTLTPRKIVCIGRNYAAHARELGNEVPEAPVVFLKPSTALVGDGGTVVLPPQTQDVHHEVELVAVIGRPGKNIPEAEALGYVAAYAVGLDMTARDLQSELKKKGLPWTLAKGFDTFAPLGPLAPAADVADPGDLEITLKVNGEVRQHGSTSAMLHSVASLVAYCSTLFTLEPGDLLYTGTPEGVAAVQDGDVLEAEVRGLPPLSVTVRREG
ncbi:MAG TPA: fumarylacetoacetate hydrolase family protein [Rhodothermales bacterium]|nr:fumarylacetoacetate hydrolase family protein [Rhodothermales bacterium]